MTSNYLESSKLCRVGEGVPKWARSIVGHRLDCCLVPNKDRELSQASVFSQGGGGVGGALLCLLRDHDQLSAHDQLSTHPKRGLGKFSLSRLHFFDSGCTFCSKLKKKNWKNSFKEIGWIMDIHTIRGFEMAWLVCCPLPWFSRFIWPIWLVSWLVIWSLVIWSLDKEGFWTLAPWSGRGEVGTQSEQRPPGG